MIRDRNGTVLSSLPSAHRTRLPLTVLSSLPSAHRTRLPLMQVIKSAGVAVEYKVGTMIEVPRACLTAGAIAEVAEFMSFGTNDLTQVRVSYR